MSKVPNKAFIIALNDKPMLVVWSTVYFTVMIKDQMREDHFEEIFGIELSVRTAKLEEQYESEYKWSYYEVESVSAENAEARATKVMNEKRFEL